MNNVKVTINGKTIEIASGTTLLELAKNYSSDFKYSIILAKVNESYKELHEQIKKDCTVEFFDLKDRNANRIYLNGLIYLTIYAASKVLRKNKLTVLHSLDKGLYIETSKEVSKEDIINLEKEMLNIVNQDLPITRVAVNRMDAINYFESINNPVKAKLMTYLTDTHVTLYKLGDMYNYLYSLMPSNTKSLKDFALTYLHQNGFILRFPTIYMDDGIKPYEHRENIYNLFKESRAWAQTLDLENVVDLNEKISNCEIEELIHIEELSKNDKLFDLAKEIYKKKDKVKVILLAGPSSTGKTTTTNKLVLCLKSLGLKPQMLSMDDYFVERTETPVDENGDPDFERLETVDLKLFEQVITSLLSGKETTIPNYNFVLGKKEFKEKMTLDKNGIILVEGIHALNPKVLENIPKSSKIRIYLSALTEINIDEHTRISTTDNRLLRRIVRDNRTRGNKVEDTLKCWEKVRLGEEKYIFPYQDEADYTFNTALVYEVGVLKTFVEPLLYSVPTISPYYNDAIRLINFLKIFLPISPESIPKDSIVREFIGGGCFRI